MKNLKPEIVDALRSDPGLLTLLGDISRINFQYPKQATGYPQITYYEADNKDFPFGDELEGATEVIMVVDVWSAGSTSDIAIAVDDVLASQGFYREFSADLYDRDDNVNRKTMRFRKLKVFDGAGGGLIPVDPWLETLAAWTETELGPEWTVYRNPFPEGFDRPAVIWVIAGMEAVDSSAAAYLVKKKAIGIVLGDVPMKHIAGATAIITGLRRDIKIVLDAAERRYLTIGRLSTDIRQESLVAGRVSVELSRRESRPVVAAPLVSDVHYKTILE